MIIPSSLRRASLLTLLVSALLVSACSSKGDRGQSDKTDRKTYNHADRISVHNCYYTADIYGSPRGIKYNIILSTSDNKAKGLFSIYEMHSNLKLRSDNIIVDPDDVKRLCADQFKIIENRPPAKRGKIVTIVIDPIPFYASVNINGNKRDVGDNIEDGLINSAMLKGITRFLKDHRVKTVPEPGWYDEPKIPEN